MKTYNSDDFEIFQSTGTNVYNSDDFEPAPVKNVKVYNSDDFQEEPDSQNPISKFVQGAGKMVYGAANAINPVNILSRAQDKRFKNKQTYNENIEGLIGAVRGVNSIVPGSEPTLGEVQGNMSVPETVGTMGTGFIRNIIPAAAGAIAGGPAGAGAGLAASNMGEFERSQRAREIAGEAPRDRNVYDELSLATDVLSGGVASKLGTAGKLGKAALSDILGGAASAAFQTGAEGEKLGDTSSMLRIGLSAGLPAAMHGATIFPNLVRRTPVQENKNVDVNLDNKNTLFTPTKENKTLFSKFGSIDGTGEVPVKYYDSNDFTEVIPDIKPDFVEPGAVDTIKRPNLLDSLGINKKEEPTVTEYKAEDFVEAPIQEQSVVEQPENEQPSLFDNQQENNNRIYGRTSEVGSTDKSWPVRYRLAELDELQTSHDPLGSFSENPNYDQRIQPRDYANVESEQQKVKMIGSKLQPENIISRVTSFDNSPPVVDSRGTVLQGNKRTMALKYADSLKNGSMEKYRKFLNENANSFGFTEDQIKSFKNPVLVREIQGDYDPVQIGSVGNARGTQALPIRKSAQSLYQGLDEEAHNNIMGPFLDAVDNEGDINLSKLNTLDGVKKAIESSIIKSIDSNEIPAYFDADNFTESGKKLLEHVLQFMSIGDSKVASSLLDSRRNNVKVSLAKAAPEILKAKATIGDNSIVNDVKAAVEVLNSSNDRIPFDDLANQTYIDPETGQSKDFSNISNRAREIGNLLVSGKSTALRKYFQDNADSFVREGKEAQLARGESLFGWEDGGEDKQPVLVDIGESFARNDSNGNTTINLQKEPGGGRGSQMRVPIEQTDVDTEPKNSLNARTELMTSVVDPANRTKINADIRPLEKRDEQAFGELNDEGNVEIAPGVGNYNRLAFVKNIAKHDGSYDGVMNHSYGSRVWKEAKELAGKGKEYEAAKKLIEEDPTQIDNSTYNFKGKSIARIANPEERVAAVNFLGTNEDILARFNNLDKDKFFEKAKEIAERLPPDLFVKKIKSGEGVNMLEVGATIVQRDSAAKEYTDMMKNPSGYSESQKNDILTRYAEATISEHAAASQSGAMLSLFSRGINTIAREAARTNDFSKWKEQVAPAILDKIYRSGTMRDMTNVENKKSLINDTKKLLELPNNDQDAVYRFLAKKVRENGIPEATLAKSMYANLLNVSTFISVAMGNATTGAEQGARNIISSTLMAKRGEKLKTSVKSTALQLAAIKAGLGESLDRASFAWKHGYSQNLWKGVQDIDNIPTMFRALGWSDENGISEGAARKLANVLNMPMRSVIAADELTRTFAEKMAAVTYAYQDVMGRGLSDKEIASEVAKRIATPDEKMQKFITEAGKQAALQKELEHGSMMYWLKNAVQSSALNPHHDETISYNLDKNGKKVYTKEGRYKEIGGRYFSVPKPLQKALGQRQRVNWFRPIVPFPNMTGNMFQVGVEYSPISILKALRTVINQGRGARVEEGKLIDQISKGAIGSALMGFGMAASMQLGGNKDKKMQDVDRALNIPYDTIDMGNTDLSVQKLGPAAVPMIAGWFAKQIYDAATADEDELRLYNDSKSEKAVDAAYRSAKALSGTFALEGALTAANALDGNPGSGGRVLGSMIAPYIPFSGTSKMINSVIDNSARKSEGFVDTALQALPAGSFLTPKRVSPLGDEQKRPSRLLSSFGISVKNQDPVYMELRRLGLPMDNPTKTTGFSGGAAINLNQKEMNDVNTSGGKLIKDKIVEFMNDPEIGYDKMSDDERRRALKVFFESAGRIKNVFKIGSIVARDPQTSGVQESFDKAARERQRGYR